jgi:tetratricopeptide (TPR) repeat protein
MELKSIAGYTIEQALGEGGMGVVYRAIDPTLDRRLALKVIRRSALSAAAKERFLREARAASRINHPNIVTVYAAGEEDGYPYLAMEFIEGRTLRAIIDEGPIPWEKATEWACDLLDALTRLHQQGIVHRDLKPENIMVTTQGTVKLMDFGIAHVSQSETLTQEGAAVGTVNYMSPEQAAGKKADARSDLFSVGTVLYQMLTGEHPFPGEHPMAIMYSITNLSPKRLSEFAFDLPAGLEAVIEKALEKDREKRYRDAPGFREALGSVRARALGAGVAPLQSLKARVLQIGVPVGAVVVLAAIALLFFGRPDAPKPNRDAARNHNELGQSAEKRGEVDVARDEYRRAIIADPSFALAWINLGALAWSDRDLAEADSCFRMAIAADSTSAKAMYNLASLRWERGDLAGAEDYYGASLEADSAFIMSYNNLGALLLESQRVEEAREWLDRGLSLDPGQPYLLKNRGIAAERLGDDSAAIGYWQRAIDMDSTITELHRLSAEWYERHGRAADARAHWQIVATSTISEEKRLATEALERLGSE